MDTVSYGGNVAFLMVGILYFFRQGFCIFPLQSKMIRCNICKVAAITEPVSQPDAGFCILYRLRCGI